MAEPLTDDELAGIAWRAYERARSAPPDPCGHYHRADYPPEADCWQYLERKN